MKRFPLLGAVLLVVGANAVGLWSARQNRAVPDGGTLELTERELPLEEGLGESTVLLLHLRTAAREDREEPFPPWLDKAKLMELGLDCHVPLDSPHAREHYDAIGPVAVLAALELAQPDAADRRNASRLRIVDVSRDAQHLRQKYPDPHQHVIMHAVVRPVLRDRNFRDGALLPQPRLTGWVNVSPRQIFVPPPHADVFQPLRAKSGHARVSPAGDPRYSVTLSWGRHFEPWVEKVRLLKPTDSPDSSSRDERKPST